MSVYIVLDGIDGSGKTLIAREIARKGGYVYWKHLNGPEHSELDHLKIPGRNDGPFEDMLVAKLLKEIGGHSVVQDRGMWSSKIYPRLQGKPIVDWRTEVHYWRDLIPKNTLYVWVDRPVNECRLGRFNSEMLEHLRAEFGYEYDTCPLPKLLVSGGRFPVKMKVDNRTDIPVSDVVDQILEVASRCS